MALTPEQITKVAHEVRLYPDGINTQLPLFVLTQQELERFAQGIEAEVRNQDNALIQQMLKVLLIAQNNLAPSYGSAIHFGDGDLWAAYENAITAARARLREKT